MTLMLIEVIYLWRALPFSSEETKLHLLDMVDHAISTYFNEKLILIHPVLLQLY